MRHAGKSGTDDWPHPPEVMPGGSPVTVSDREAGALTARITYPPDTPEPHTSNPHTAEPHPSNPQASAPHTPMPHAAALHAPAPHASATIAVPAPAAEAVTGPVEPAKDAKDAQDAKDTEPAAKPRARLYVIDALRLFAAVMVAMHHFAGTRLDNLPNNDVWNRPVSDIMPTVFRVSAYGWMGVEIFFVISGFVICMSCWGRGPRDFFVSRVIRLYPAYWFGVIFTFTVLQISSAVWPKQTLKTALFNLSMLQSGSFIHNVDGVYWTLWSELRFYLIFMFVVAAGLTYRKVVLFCCVWGALATLAPASDWRFLVLITDPEGAWYFIAGLSLFLMYRFGQDLLLWGILVMSWLMAQQELAHRITTVEGVSSWRGALTIYTLFLLFMVGVARGLTDRIQWKWLVTAGSLTYPFYLIHYTAGTTAIHYLRGRTDARLLVAGLIVGGLLLAYLIHRLVERPVARLLKRGLTDAFVKLGPPSARKAQ
jgi:peptidoglycan/LPS O-acetylase OafA/YrhL